MKTAGLTKKQLRIERKKKLSAFLAIAELNDEDKYEKQLKLSEKNEQSSDKNSEESEGPDSNLNLMSGDGPSRKRLKKEGSDLVDMKYCNEVSVDEQINDLNSNNQGVPYMMNSCFNYPCTEDPYYSYYNSTVEDHVYQEPFLFEVLPSTPEENQAYNNYYQYQSYEIRRHHNSETFYYKTDEELYSIHPEGFERKISSILSLWDETNYIKKNHSENFKTNRKPESYFVQETGESYEQLKKQLRDRKKFLKCLPRLLLKESGERASLEMNQDERVPLFVSDILDLLVYSQTEHTFYKPRWCTFEKVNRLTKCIIMVVEGFSFQDYIENESSFTILKNDLFTKVEVIMPGAYGGNLIEELSTVPLCPSQQRKICEEQKISDKLLVTKPNRHARYKALRALFPITSLDPKIEELPKGDKFPRTELLLSAWQLLEENFPVPMKGALKLKYHYYVQTKDEYAEVTPLSPMFALDCEMCRTVSGQLELTRISVVNEELETVYDTLVKPYNKITDYLTRFSGITKKILDPINVRLSDVQKKIREILPADAILIGQSLSCDLHAMQMMHPYIIDTSVIFNITGIRSRKTKLMTLSREFLSEKIQESAHGHCSTEDSLACMKLVKLKLAHSIEFGDAVLVGRPTAELHLQKIQNQNDIKKTEDAEATLRGFVDGRLSTNLLFQIANADKKGTVVGTQQILSGYLNFPANKSNKKSKANIRGLVADAEKGIINRTCEVALENDFVLSHIQLAEEDKEKTIKKIKKWTRKLLNITPINGMCLILMGGGLNGVCFIHINRPTIVHLP